MKNQNARKNIEEYYLLHSAEGKRKSRKTFVLVDIINRSHLSPEEEAHKLAYPKFHSPHM